MSEYQEEVDENGLKFSPQRWFNQDNMPEKCGCITYDRHGWFLWRHKPMWNKSDECWGNNFGANSDRGLSWIGGLPLRNYFESPIPRPENKKPRYWTRETGKVRVGDDDIPVSNTADMGSSINKKRKTKHLLPDGYFKDDSNKTRFSLLPWMALTAVADLMTKNAESHGAEGWRTRENGQQRYREALQRHIAATWRGEEEDPDGFHHLAAVAANALIALELKINEQNNQV